MTVLTGFKLLYIISLSLQVVEAVKPNWVEKGYVHLWSYFIPRSPECDVRQEEIETTFLQRQVF